MRSKSRSNIVVVGIAPWGVIQGREQLKGQNVNIQSSNSNLIYFCFYLSKLFLIIQQLLLLKIIARH
jgi:hypothetical protein